MRRKSSPQIDGPSSRTFGLCNLVSMRVSLTSPPDAKIVTVGALLRHSMRSEHFLEIWDVSADEAQETNTSLSPAAKINVSPVQKQENISGNASPNANSVHRLEKPGLNPTIASNQAADATQAKPPEKRGRRAWQGNLFVELFGMPSA